MLISSAQGEALVKCQMCNQPGEHTFQYRDGDPLVDLANPNKPYQSRVLVVSLCHQHWIALKQFVGI